ncbi:MAG: hypothetical protein WCJ39_06985 [bacterium]
MEEEGLLWGLLVVFEVAEDDFEEVDLIDEVVSLEVEEQVTNE